MVDIFKSVKTGYNQFAPYFSRSRAYNWPDVASVASKLPQGACVLDLGCGNARLIDVLPKDTKYTGIDFSAGLLAEAKKLHPKSDFVEADITGPKAWRKLGKFDAIFCVAVFHHIPTQKQQLYLLGQIKGHLKTGGVTYITAWNLLQPRFAGDHLRSLPIKFRNPRWVRVPFMNQWQRLCFTLNASYLKKLAIKAEFKNVTVEYKSTKGDISNFWRGQNLTLEARV
jgi:SAM-dependent methyltransferase